MTAGLFYCPYVPLQMVRAVGENSFQPKIGFKTRYGIVAAPLREGLTQGLGRLRVNSNSTTEELYLRTSCDPSHHSKTSFGGSFLYILNTKK